MAKKAKKEKVEEKAPVEEPVPEPVPEGRKLIKEIPGIGFTTKLYDNGESEKIYD